MCDLDSRDQQDEFHPPVRRSRVWWWFGGSALVALTVVSLFVPALQVIATGLNTLLPVLVLSGIPVYFIFRKAQMRLLDLLFVVAVVGGGTGLLSRAVQESRSIPGDAKRILVVVACLVGILTGLSGAALGLWMVKAKRVETNGERLKLIAAGLGLPLSFISGCGAIAYVISLLAQDSPELAALAGVAYLLPCLAVFVFGLKTLLETLTLKTRAKPKASPKADHKGFATHGPEGKGSDSSSEIQPRDDRLATLPAATHEEPEVKPFATPVDGAAVTERAGSTDVPRRPCPQCGEMIPMAAQLCRFCRSAVGAEEKPPGAEGALAAPKPVASEQGDATGGVIPYKNVPALLAYYCGVFSLIPCFLIGVAAVILGYYGLKKVKETPAVRGTVHAWIGIGLGGFFGLLWLIGLIVGLIATNS